MADSSIQLPTDGAGKNVDTRTVSGDHRQVVVVGDETATDIAPVDATSGLKVDLGADNDVTVTGTVAVTDNGGSLTVDGTVQFTDTISGGTLTEDGGGAGIHTSSGNSFDSNDLTTAPDLPAGETFQGAWEDLNDYYGVLITLNLEEDSALGSVDFSTDGTDAGIIRTTAVLLTANTGGLPFHVIKQARYFRVVYVQGATDGEVRVSTTLLRNATPGSISPLGTALSDQQIGLQTKSVLQGKDSAGLYRSAQISAEGAILTADFLTEVALGNVTGESLVVKFGRNSEINIASTPEDFWEGSGLYTGHPTGSAETVNVFSDNTADTSAGTGARNVVIEGLNGSNVLTSETITMNGTTAVTSSNSYNRVFRAYVATAGSGGENAGIITVRHTTTTANVFASILAGFNQ